MPSGLILHGGNRGDCLRCPLPLPWCTWNAPVEIYNFLIGYPLARRKCIGALRPAAFIENDLRWVNSRWCTVLVNYMRYLLENKLLWTISWSTYVCYQVIGCCIHKVLSKWWGTSVCNPDQLNSTISFIGRWNGKKIVQSHETCWWNKHWLCMYLYQRVNKFCLNCD